MELTRLRATFGTPRPAGPMIDGFTLREFHLSVPSDAPPGATLIYVLTAAGQPMGEVQTLVLSFDEMPDPRSCFEALTAWATAALRAKARIPDDSVSVVETFTPEQPKAPAEPGVVLG